MKKFFTIISLLLATLVGLALPATGHAASWGDRDGQWNSRLGTLTATMLPYSLCFLVGWTLLLILWLAFGLPIGPGTGLYL